MSRPARGAWIEMLIRSRIASNMYGRAPHGARGLKSKRYTFYVSQPMSRPARGAWIEIMNMLADCSMYHVAPRTGRVD